MGLGNWLKRRKPHPVWAIKQIDDDLLHLCGKANVKNKTGATQLLQALRQGDFNGPVHMQENGAVLNAAQFHALIPEQDIVLTDDNHAQWRNRRWRLSWVPQRCWLHEGRLISQQVTLQSGHRLVSLEDTSGIRAKAATPKPHNNHISLEPKDSSNYWQLLDKDDYRS